MKETSKKIMEKRIQQVVEKETINLWNKWWDITNTLQDLGEIVNVKNVYPTIMIDVKESEVK